eukprot:3292967-Amphidinium_carterae.2
MKIAYLSLDRADLLESVRHMAAKGRRPVQTKEGKKVLAEAMPERQRSTTGAFTMLGNHYRRGQSSGENECYALVKAAAQRLHTAAVCKDLGLESR